MLVKNPLTRYLYEFGYNGIENIYEYWKQNSSSILKAYRIRRQAKPTDVHDLIAFKYKIRWASHTGLFLRLAMDRHIREAIPDEPLSLEEIVLRRHHKVKTLAQFSRSSFGDDALETHIDLRGLSLLSKTIAKTKLQSIDFSHGALDSCIFEDVVFNNCLFEGTSFRNCIIRHCTFDSECRFTNNDFSNVYLEADFNCAIASPTITRFKKHMYWAHKYNRESRYLRYSKIISPSFKDQCTDKEISRYLNEFQRKFKL